MNSTDEILWQKCMEGRREAFQALYSRYYSLMFNYGLKFVPDKEFIKDCVHEVFVRLIQGHKSLSATSFVKGYLLRACKNRIFDELERQRHTEDITQYENIFQTDDLSNALFEENETFSDNDMRKLADAYRKIPVRQQEIIYLYYISGLKHEEIVTVMDINYQSSKNLLFRAVRNLRKHFGD